MRSESPVNTMQKVSTIELCSHRFEECLDSRFKGRLVKAGRTTIPYLEYAHEGSILIIG